MQKNQDDLLVEEERWATDWLGGQAESQVEGEDRRGGGVRPTPHCGALHPWCRVR